LQFLVDENLHVGLAALIRSQGHDAVSVRETSRCGSSDAEIWDWAARTNAVLVTLDLDFPLIGRRPRPLALVLLRPRDHRLATISALWTEWARPELLAALPGRIVSVRRGRSRTRGFERS